MCNLDFVNHYETLEISPKASFDTIERVFRFLAKRHHPDSTEAADPQRFKALVHAYEVLSDPEQRAAFDNALDRHQQEEADLEKGAGSVTDDAADRHRLLSLFYAKRRRDMKYPGIGIATVEQMMNIPPEVLDFHIWYFREKGWIAREEGGTISITAEGVDRLENSNQARQQQDLKRITDESHRLEDRTIQETSPPAPNTPNNSAAATFTTV